MYISCDKPVVWVGRLVSAAVSARRHDSPAPPLVLAATSRMTSAAPGSHSGCQARNLLSNKKGIKNVKAKTNYNYWLYCTVYTSICKTHVLVNLVCKIQERLMQLHSLSTSMQSDNQRPLDLREVCCEPPFNCRQPNQVSNPTIKRRTYKRMIEQCVRLIWGYLSASKVWFWVYQL